jgi:RNA polymerase sigma-70 factor (ECF subfamily)
MLATARRFVGSEDEARDVVQEAFLAAFRAIDGFAGTALLSTWLHRIVVNAALMKLRSRRRRREEPIDGLLPRFDEEGYWADGAAPSETATDMLIESDQTRAMVRKAIDQLPANYRSVLLLRDIEELDTDETATLLGVTPNAVKTRLHRARQALRTLLEREMLAETRRSGRRAHA